MFVSHHVHQFDLPSTPQAPGMARHVVADLHPSEACVDDVLLVVSELVTNAVEHGAPPMSLTVTEQPETATWLVEVYDASAEMPYLRTSENPTAPGGGRGIHIIDEIATQWGVRDDPLGKCVWATLVAAPSTRL